MGIDFESTMTMHARLMTRQRNTENYQMLYEKLSTEIKLSINCFPVIIHHRS